MTHSSPTWPVPLDPPVFPADRYERLAQRIGALLGADDHDIVLVPGEAVVALEAVAREVGGSGARVLNIVTSVYGRYFGDWLRAGGAAVTELEAEPGRPIEAAAVAHASTAGFDAVAFVHGEAASGIVNPIREILDIARAAGAISIVDAVASVGAEPIDLSDDGPDILIIGPQKALGGPAALSAVAIDARGWTALRRDARAPRFSSLSLLDLRRDWLDTDRTVVPGTPHAHDLWALEGALERVETEGIDALVERHRCAARAARAGVVALGLALWVEEDALASGLVTGVLVPSAAARQEIADIARRRFGVVIGIAAPDVDDRLVRLSHIGPRASFASVLSGVVALGSAVLAAGGTADVGAGAAAVAEVYS